VLYPEESHAYYNFSNLIASFSSSKNLIDLKMNSIQKKKKKKEKEKKNILRKPKIRSYSIDVLKIMVLM